MCLRGVLKPIRILVRAMCVRRIAMRCGSRFVMFGGLGVLCLEHDVPDPDNQNRRHATLASCGALTAASEDTQIFGDCILTNRKSARNAKGTDTRWSVNAHDLVRCWHRQATDFVARPLACCPIRYSI